MRRNTIEVSPKELFELAYDLLFELISAAPEGVFDSMDDVVEQHCIVPIINPEGLSDTWKLELGKAKLKK